MDYDFEGEDVGAYPNGLSEKDFRYDVGYAKPPKHVWFKNGVSGNPRGKPIGATNKPKVLKPPLLVEMLRDAPSHGVQVMDGEDRVIVSEPPRDCQRPVYLSYAAMARLSMAA